jgi:hypothetical protein
MMNKQSKHHLAEHFGGLAIDFHYVNGRGWYYKDQFIGRSMYDVQTSTYWALKKLPGRDTF